MLYVQYMFNNIYMLSKTSMKSEAHLKAYIRCRRCGSGRFPGRGNGNLLQYSFLENSVEEEPGGLQSMGLQRVGHDYVTEHTCMSV